MNFPRIYVNSPKACPKCSLKHSVLLRTRFGPRCIYCTRLEHYERAHAKDRETRLRKQLV